MAASTYPAQSKHCIVSSHFLCPAVTSSTVGQEYNDAGNESNTGHGKNELLGPGLGVLSPRGFVVLVSEGLGGVENGESSRKHGEDDEGTTEVNTSEGHLGQANARLDFLTGC